MHLSLSGIWNFAGRILISAMRRTNAQQPCVLPQFICFIRIFHQGSWEKGLILPFPPVGVLLLLLLLFTSSNFPFKLLWRKIIYPNPYASCSLISTSQASALSKDLQLCTPQTLSFSWKKGPQLLKATQRLWSLRTSGLHAEPNASQEAEIFMEKWKSSGEKIMLETRHFISGFAYS